MESTIEKSKLDFRKSNPEKFEFNDILEFDLKNYIDRSIYQTMVDSKQHDSEQFRIIKKPLFKADKNDKNIDEIEVNCSAIIPAIYKILGNN